jgi:peptidoglycan/LPS O-acetylase OafA/YrhL
MTTSAPGPSTGGVVPPPGGGAGTSEAVPPSPSGPRRGAHSARRPAHVRTSATGRERVVALDGLRAFAVLIIMGYHFGVGHFQGGFFSLDIFYVLSGYLITGLLLGEWARSARIKLSAFWLRRARRLLPALAVVLVVVSLVVRFTYPAGVYPDLRMADLSALFYFSNWWQIASSGNYFAATGAISPLTHTWSLAVEEQFYLVWPLVVLAVLHLARRLTRPAPQGVDPGVDESGDQAGDRGVDQASDRATDVGVRLLLAISVVGVVASATEMAWLYHPRANITRLYFGTDTHAQSILVGSVLACVLTLVQRRRGLAGMAPRATAASSRIVLTVVGLAGVVGTVVLTATLSGTSATAYRGGFLISALSAAALITGAVCVTGGPIARVLSVRPMVWMGTVSYGAYLWHYPVFIELDGARTGLGGLGLLVVRVAATFTLAALSYYLIERPVMEGVFWRSARAAGSAFAALAVTVAVVVAGTAAQADAAAPGAGVGLVGAPATAAEWQAVHLTSFAGAGNRTRVLIVGDSLALTVSVGIAPYARSYGIDLGGRSHTGCGVAIALPLDDHGVVGDPFGNCPTWPTWWADDIRQLHPQVVGLVIGFWEVIDRVYQGRWQHLGEPAFDAYETAQLERAVKLLGSGGARVALFTAPYFRTGEQPDGGPWPQDATARVDRLNQIIEAVARRHPGNVTVIPLHAFLDPAGKFTWTIGGKVVRQGDGVHTTLAGGTYLAPKVLPLLAAAGAHQ